MKYLSMYCGRWLTLCSLLALYTFPIRAFSYSHWSKGVYSKSSRENTPCGTNFRCRVSCASLSMTAIDPRESNNDLYAPKSQPSTDKAIATQSLYKAMKLLSSSLFISTISPYLNPSKASAVDSIESDETLKQSYFSSSDITHKAFIDIKIANYTEESRGTNKPAIGSGRVVIGLFGKDAPHAVDIFLKVSENNSKVGRLYQDCVMTELSHEH